MDSVEGLHDSSNKGITCDNSSEYCNNIIST